MKWTNSYRSFGLKTKRSTGLKTIEHKHRVRDAMPDPLREWIDAQDEATRRDSLRALLHADGESGWRAAVAGMLEILESTGGTDRAGVWLAAARHASGLGPVAYDDPVDLSEYDIAYTKEDE